MQYTQFVQDVCRSDPSQPLISRFSAMIKLSFIGAAQSPPPTHTHTYIHTYTHTYIHACIHACIHTYQPVQCDDQIISHGATEATVSQLHDGVPAALNQLLLGNQLRVNVDLADL